MVVGAYMLVTQQVAFRVEMDMCQLLNKMVVKKINVLHKKCVDNMQLGEMLESIIIIPMKQDLKHLYQMGGLLLGQTDIVTNLVVGLQVKVNGKVDIMFMILII